MIIGVIGNGNNKVLVDHLVKKHGFVEKQWGDLLYLKEDTPNVVMDIQTEEAIGRLRSLEGHECKVWACLTPEKLTEDAVQRKVEGYDAVFPNYGDDHHLHLLVDAVMDSYSGRMKPYDPEQDDDVPPFLRK